MTFKNMMLARRDGSLFETTMGEAFCLMKYVNSATGKVEWLWNSRDGVTPFGLEDSWPDSMATMQHLARWSAGERDLSANPDPRMMQHADWHEDAFLPNFTPPIGFRVFVSWCDAPQSYKAHMKARWMERCKRIAADMGEPVPFDVAGGEPYGFKPDDPCVIVVDEELRDVFQARARDNPITPRPAPRGFGGQPQGHG